MAGAGGGLAGGTPGGAGRPPASLPCQESNNCIEKERREDETLSPYRWKCRYRLIMAIEWMVNRYGLNYVGVLTLTFGVPGSGRGSQATRELRELAKELDFVQKRWHSLNSNIISKRYRDWILVLEAHKDGVWHIHVVVALDFDIRTGTDIETLTNYKLPYWMRRGKHLRNEALGAEWHFLREICCRYRFGRVELLPIKKTGAALAHYLANYLTKSFRLIPPGQKSRLVRLSRGVSSRITMKFSPVTLGNLIYRTRLKIAASMLHFQDYGDFADYFGPRWNYYIGDNIADIPVPTEFKEGWFEMGLAADILNSYAKNAAGYADDDGKIKLAAVERSLWRKFRELALDEWNDPRSMEADNIDVGPLTEADLQGDLLETSDDPF